MAGNPFDENDGAAQNRVLDAVHQRPTMTLSTTSAAVHITPGNDSSFSSKRELTIVPCSCHQDTRETLWRETEEEGEAGGQGGDGRRAV